MDSFVRSSRRGFLKQGATVTLAAATVAAASSAAPQQPIAGNSKSKIGDGLPRVTVHSNGRFLVRADGTPFFWLGDTAWQLIQELTREECSYYLQSRMQQGFSVIQTVVLAEFGGIEQPTTLGLLPFRNSDPSQPNEDFFDRVVEIVDEASNRGLYVALVPTWGDKLTAPWGTGPRVFRNDNLEVAQGYAHYLAAKLKNRTNALWVLGGDRPPRVSGAKDDYITKTAVNAGFVPDQDWTPIWGAMAAGLKSGSESIPTIVYHPQGGRESSSYFLHNEPWLSMNGMQSGHGGGHDVPVWEMIEHDYNLSPAKPTLDLEPNYEDHPYNPWPEWDPATGYYRDHDVRKQVYRSVFAGGCGVTYGHHAVWQFASKRHEVINHADRDWIDALDRPAARQVGFLRLLMESRPFFRRVPAQKLIVGDAGQGGQHLQATMDRDGTYAFIYFPNSDQRATIDLGLLKGEKIRTWWFDPRTGVGSLFDNLIPAEPTYFKSPPFGPDWVLALDSETAAYPPPGLSRIS